MNRLLIAVGLWIAASAAVAGAQSTAPLTPPGASNGGTPAPAPDKGIAAGPSSGVINPGNPDPGMAVVPPTAGITPIVPPPGTAGNNPAVVPK